MLLRLLVWFLALSFVLSVLRAFFDALGRSTGGAAGSRRAGGSGRARAGRGPRGFGRAPGQARRRALETLGLEEGANRDEIRSAYRTLAQKYHPDRVAHLGPELVELTSQKFREIRDAYELLDGKA